MNCFCCSAIRANRQHGCGKVGGAFCHCTFLRARHLHGGKRHVLEKLSRQALLEQAMRQTVEQRAATSPQSRMSSSGNVHSVSVFVGNTEKQSAPMQSETVNEDITQNKYSASLSNVENGNGSHTTLPSLEQKEQNNMMSNITIPIRSLSDFFAQCKQFRCRIGAARSETARRREREAFREFWIQHVGSAVQCCAKRGRDFGFVAANGLSDHHLHIAFSSMKLALRVIREEANVCSARDMMVSLHYLARELHWWQKTIKYTPSQMRSSIVELHHDSFQPLPTQRVLDRFRSDLIDLIFDRVVFFFITHASPAFSSPRTANTSFFSSCTASNNTECEVSANEELSNVNKISEEMCDDTNAVIASDSSVTNGLIADADDALNALEALSHIHLRDATPETMHKLTDIVAKSTAHHKYFTNMSSSPTRNYKHNNNIHKTKTYSAASSLSNKGAEIILTQRFFVSILFQFVVMQRRQLKMTSLVQAFALLRIFWPELHEQSINARQQTQIHKELHYICWGLALSLRKHDARFVNPYHFVKIVVTLEKLPYWLLSPTPLLTLQRSISEKESGSNNSSRSNNNLNSVNSRNSTKTHLSSFHSFMLSHSQNTKSREDEPKDVCGNSILARNSVWEAAATNTENKEESNYYYNNDKSGIEEMPFYLPQDATVPQQSKSKSVTLTSEQFWQYIISKACIFVPMLSSQERRIVYYKLYQCIIIKRGNLLGHNCKEQKASNVKMMVAQNDQNLKNKAEAASPFAPLSMISSWEAMYANHHHHLEQERQQQWQQLQNSSNNNNYSSTTTTIVTSLTDSAEDILLPLSEEMNNLNEDTNAIISGHQTNRHPSHAQHLHSEVSK